MYDIEALAAEWWGDIARRQIAAERQAGNDAPLRRLEQQLDMARAEIARLQEQVNGLLWAIDVRPTAATTAPCAGHLWANRPVGPTQVCVLCGWERMKPHRPDAVAATLDNAPYGTTPAVTGTFTDGTNLYDVCADAQPPSMWRYYGSPAPQAAPAAPPPAQEAPPERESWMSDADYDRFCRRVREAREQANG